MRESKKKKKQRNPKNKAIIWHALKLVITILNYFAYKYQLSPWENVKPKEKCLEVTEV